MIIISFFFFFLLFCDCARVYVHKCTENSMKGSDRRGVGSGGGGLVPSKESCSKGTKSFALGLPSPALASPPFPEVQRHITEVCPDATERLLLAGWRRRHGNNGRAQREQTVKRSLTKGLKRHNEKCIRKKKKERKAFAAPARMLQGLERVRRKEAAVHRPCDASDWGAMISSCNLVCNVFGSRRTEAPCSQIEGLNSKNQKKTSMTP